MLFSKSKNIIVFLENKIVAHRVGFKDNQPFVEKKLEFPFDWRTLAGTITQIKKQLNTSEARILLPADKTYLLLLQFPLQTQLTRTLVLTKAQEAIPEKLDEGFFDWKQVSKDKNSQKTQVLAANHDFLLALTAAADKAKFKLEAFEPPSFALARLTKSEKEPHLIVFNTGTASLLCVAFQGQVFEAITVVDASQINNKSEQLSRFVKDKWGIEAKKTISQGLDPVSGLALKEDLKGSDEKVLNLNPPEVKAGPAPKGSKVT